MKRAEAEYFIEQAIARKIDLGFTKHFWDEARECAPGLSKSDVYGALRSGVLVGAPVRDDAYLCHKVRLRADLPDFGRLEFVLAIIVRDSLVCITIYGVD